MWRAISLENKQPFSADHFFSLFHFSFVRCCCFFFFFFSICIWFRCRPALFQRSQSYQKNSLNKRKMCSTTGYSMVSVFRCQIQCTNTVRWPNWIQLTQSELNGRCRLNMSDQCSGSLITNICSQPIDGTQPDNSHSVSFLSIYTFCGGSFIGFWPPKWGASHENHFFFKFLFNIKPSAIL